MKQALKKKMKKKGDLNKDGKMSSYETKRSNAIQKAGTNHSKKISTISDKAYKNMLAGFPKKKK